MNGSPGRKTCVRPSGGALKTTNEIIGHQLVRSSAGTASGTSSFGDRVEARMRLGADRHVLGDLEVEQQLVGVVVLAERAERRPLDAGVRIGAEIAFQHHLAVALRDAQFVVERIEQLDAVLRAFDERHAVPGVFVRAVPARLRLAGPARHLHLRAARHQARLEQAVFDGLHQALLLSSRCCGPIGAASTGISCPVTVAAGAHKTMTGGPPPHPTRLASPSPPPYPEARRRDAWTSHPNRPARRNPRGSAASSAPASPASTGASWTSSAAIPPSSSDALTEAGYLAALIPEEYGGAGLPLSAAAAILETVQAEGCNGAACHAQMYIMGTILRHGSDGAEDALPAEDRHRRAAPAGVRRHRTDQRHRHHLPCAPSPGARAITTSSTARRCGPAARNIPT